MAKVLRTKWYGETLKTLQINGKSKRTQECYGRAVRMLTEYFGKEPDGITGEELRDYFLYRKNECGWMPDTMKICSCGNRHCPVCQHRKAAEWTERQFLSSGTGPVGNL
ncbi:MAG: phage integrase N-terminal SAM-like domain-containing protein [Desulfococcaceae bacterium]|nr:phage integrase N-terminal SAM-like domain-containing protein [Desulfococcaceae bacterium]